MLSAGARARRSTLSPRCVARRARLSTSTTPKSTSAAATARQYTQPPPPTPSSPHTTSTRPDPFKIVAPQVNELHQNLIRLLGSSHPSLTDIASYYFTLGGKQLRPLLVLLLSRATNGLASGWDAKRTAAENGPHRRVDLDRPLTSAEVLTDWNPRMPDHSASFSTVFSIPPSQILATPPLNDVSPAEETALLSLDPSMTILPTQMRLAQIAEMIHVASLLHDDVLDESSLRRAAPSAPFLFGNKLTILGGDFLLGRTSSALARLGECEVVELIASVISNLVEGEVMQAREAMAAEAAGSILGSSSTKVEEVDRWTQYLRKTYFKTASLMAKSARAAVVLGGTQSGVQQDEFLKDVAYAYGRNIGIAFQIIDDALDFSTSAELGKPGSGADLQLGLATAPALYAWEEHEAMGPLIARRFKGEGDVEMARDFVLRSDALPRTRKLAQQYADKAREVLAMLPPSEAREALDVLTEKVVSRSR